MLGLTELTRINYTSVAISWSTAGIAPDGGSDRTGDRRATRHATGLVFLSVQHGVNGIRTRKSKPFRRVLIWPDLGAELVSCVYPHSQ